MKKWIYLMVVALLVSSCSKKSDNPSPSTRKAIIKDVGLIPFKAIPLADNQLKLAFLKNQQRVLTSVVLRIDTATLATMAVLDDGNRGSVSATFNYAFQPGKTYNFVVTAKDPASDTIYHYQVQGYAHRFVKSFKYQKVLSLQQSLGPDNFDLSPLRNYLFIGDYVNNVTQLKRVSLQDLSVQPVATIIDLNGSPIRAVSDNELLVYANKNTNISGLPATADPGNDAIILCRYDLNSQKSSFVDYVSSGYGRVSRIINNHVLVTNPIFTAQTASLIDLGSLNKVKFPLSSFDFTTINEYSFGHILHSNSIVNPANGSIVTPVNVNSNSGLIELDDATGYAFVGSGRTDAGGKIATGYSVYKNNTPVYQSDFIYGSHYFPIIYNIRNDIVTFYQSYGYDTVVNIDGYYTLNLKTKEVKLIQDDSNLYVISDYQMKDGSTLSVRADGVYKLMPL